MRAKAKHRVYFYRTKEGKCQACDPGLPEEYGKHLRDGVMDMKRKKRGASVSLNEVFARSEKDPKWAAAYAEADLEVRVALQIAKAREKAHLNQKQLAKAVGTTQSGISRIEHGEQNLTIATLQKIAKAVGNEVVIELRPR